jgi:hypothetical protein
VGQSLVKVENEDFGDAEGPFLEWQVYLLVQHLLLVHGLQLLKEVDGLKDVDCELTHGGRLQFSSLSTLVIVLRLSVAWLVVGKDDVLVRRGRNHLRDHLIKLILVGPVLTGGLLISHYFLYYYKFILFKLIQI